MKAVAGSAGRSGSEHVRDARLPEGPSRANTLRTGPGEMLLDLLIEEARTWNPRLAPGHVAVVRTEPHVLAKYVWLTAASLRTIDLSAKRDGVRGATARLRVARELERELRRASERDLAGVGAFVLDVSEGWFATTVNHLLRRIFPNPVLIGLQHGAMELSGPESATWVRRARVWATAAQCDLLGGAVVGAGFGNNRFHVYACYGGNYRDYVRRLWPECRILTSFGGLTRASIEAARDRELPFDVLVLGQELREYGVSGEDDIYRRVLRRLDQVSAHGGLRVRVKLHPKQRPGSPLAAEYPAIEFTREGELADMLSTRLAAVISFNSTGLLEAAYVGCPIVAIRAPGVREKYNAPFAEMIDLEDFAERWDVGQCSRVRAGEIGDE